MPQFLSELEQIFQIFLLTSFQIREKIYVAKTFFVDFGQKSWILFIYRRPELKSVASCVIVNVVAAVFLLCRLFQKSFMRRWRHERFRLKSRRRIYLLRGTFESKLFANVHFRFVHSFRFPGVSDVWKCKNLNYFESHRSKLQTVDCL